MKEMLLKKMKLDKCRHWTTFGCLENSCGVNVHKSNLPVAQYIHFLSGGPGPSLGCLPVWFISVHILSGYQDD